MPTVTWMFVDKPEKTANVLLDMNQNYGGNKIVLNFGRKFDISPPAKKRSFATNSLMNGGRLTSAAFDNRTLEFSISLQGTLEEKSANLAKLNYQLAQFRNLIMYTPRPGVVEPVFFRTFVSDEYTIVNRSEKGAWHVDCQVVAEPFAIGERKQPIDHVLTSNDPASPSNAQRLDFPTIIGDAPAPAFAHIQWGAGTNLERFNTFYLASRTHHNQYFHSNWQFVTADINAGVGDSFMFSGGDTSGGSAAATNFASSNTLNTRAYFDTGDLVTDVYSIRGRYRILIRVHCSVVPSTFAVRLRDERFSTGFVYSKLLTWNADSTSHWDHLDFGVFSHPAYETPNEFGLSGQAPGVGQMAFSLEAQRLSGTGNLEFDYVTFLPADESLCMVSTHQSQSDIILDGPNEMVYGMWDSSPFDTQNQYWYYLYQGNGLMPWRGSIPDLVPGAPNSWFFFNDRGAMTQLFTFNVYYWPRWLEVATP